MEFLTTGASTIMTNHPNRSKRRPDPAHNPTPAEIRAAREQAGLTQKEAGLLVFSTLNTWQKWEAGNRRMHPAFWLLFRLLLLLSRPEFYPAALLVSEGAHDDRDEVDYGPQEREGPSATLREAGNTEGQ